MPLLTEARFLPPHLVWNGRTAATNCDRHFGDGEQIPVAEFVWRVEQQVTPQ